MTRWFLPISMICLVMLTSCQHSKNKPHNPTPENVDTIVMEETNVSNENAMQTHSSIEHPTQIKYKVFSSVAGWDAHISSWIKVLKDVEAYNLCLQHEQTPEPTKLERLLNNIERAEVIYNRLMGHFGGKEVQINKNLNGLMEIVNNVESH